MCRLWSRGHLVGAGAGCTEGEAGDAARGDLQRRQQAVLDRRERERLAMLGAMAGAGDAFARQMLEEEKSDTKLMKWLVER